MAQLALAAFHGACSGGLRCLAALSTATLGLPRADAPVVAAWAHPAAATTRHGGAVASPITATSPKPCWASWADPLSRAYAELGALHHAAHCPVLVVAAWSLTRGGWSWRQRHRRAHSRKAAGSRQPAAARSEAGRLSPAGQRARCRLRLALLLSRNPDLQRWRAHRLAALAAAQQGPGCSAGLLRQPPQPPCDACQHYHACADQDRAAIPPG